MAGKIILAILITLIVGGIYVFMTSRILLPIFLLVYEKWEKILIIVCWVLFTVIMLYIASAFWFEAFGKSIVPQNSPSCNCSNA